jgi:hypothetical protein
MDVKDFPVKYGGELKWEPGDMPHLDEETRAALEKDGNKGWVRGPCYWLDGKRVVVGSQGGKPRATPEVEKMKPVVYAADYTEHPVHPDRKASNGSSKKNAQTNGTALPHQLAEQAAITAAVGGVTGAERIAANTEEPKPTPTQPAAASEGATAPAPQPGAQPVPPTMTSIKTGSEAMPPPPQPSNAPSAPTSTLVSSETHVPPAAQPTPGPPSDHAKAMTTAISDRLAGESVSVIPPTSNGHAKGPNGFAEGTPEVIVASDPSKGLAIEAEKLKIAETNGVERPPMERFVTALEG